MIIVIFTKEILVVVVVGRTKSIRNHVGDSTRDVEPMVCCVNMTTGVQLKNVENSVTVPTFVD